MNTTVFKLLAMCLLVELACAKLFYVEVKYPLLGKESAPGSPWPMPSTMDSTSNNLLFLNKNQFQIFSDLANCDIIQKNIMHYMNVLFPPKIYDASKHANIDQRFLLNQLYIRINSTQPVCPGYPDSNMDESYEIQVSGPKAQIVAPQVWGAIRGLETFSQLTFFTDNELLALNDSTRICDNPRFKYRGLLIDTARHFIPVPVLKKQIDGMSYNKLNILHWHIVDDQSYPYESLLFPDLTKNGAYSKAHVYTQQQIKDIIDHARLRGIRVIPEFDSPGHVESFGRTFKDLMTICWNNGKPFEAIYSVQGKVENLDPTNERVYQVWDQLLGEAGRLFVDDYVHLGNDEVYYECWKSNPNITEWMKRMNFTEYHELQAFYSSKLVNLVKGLNKKVTVWQDVYDNGVRLEKDTHIQIWRDTDTISTDKKWYEYLNEVTQDGYQAILSSPWYINFVSYGYKEWFKWYEVEPLAFFTGTEEQSKLLIGGEAALWSEYVDGTNIETRLWPRVSPIAERLWSPASVNNSEDAKFRLDEHRCRLLRRGIPASPVLNGYCGPYEYGMEKSVIFDPVFNYGWPTL